MSLFSAKDQLMNEADKPAFGQFLKQKVSTATSNQSVGFQVIDGGWILRQCAWEKGDLWRTIGKNTSNVSKVLDTTPNRLLLYLTGITHLPKTTPIDVVRNTFVMT